MANHLNYSQSNKSQSSSVAVSKQCTGTFISENSTPFPTEMDINPSHIEYLDGNYIDSNGPISTTVNDAQTNYHPLHVKDPEYHQFLDHYQGKTEEQILQSEVMPSIYRVVKVRDSGSTPAQTALQAAALIINKSFPDRIQVDRRSLEIQMTAKDLTKLMEMAQTMQVVDKTED